MITSWASSQMLSAVLMFYSVNADRDRPGQVSKLARGTGIEALVDLERVERQGEFESTYKRANVI